MEEKVRLKRTFFNAIIIFRYFFTKFLFHTFLFIYLFLIVCLLADLLEGVEVNPERPSKKQSEHHMPSFGKYKQETLILSLVFPYPFLMILRHFKVFIAPSISCTFVYPSLKEKGL